MDERTPARLRGAPLAAARVVALIVSIGVAAFLVARAGAGGCRSVDAEVQAEAPPAASSADAEYFPGTKADTRLVRPAAPAAGRYGTYFPGSKADPHIVRTAPDPSGAPAGKRHYFPDSKAPLGGSLVDDPDPPAAGGR